MKTEHSPLLTNNGSHREPKKNRTPRFSFIILSIAAAIIIGLLNFASNHYYHDHGATARLPTSHFLMGSKATLAHNMNLNIRPGSIFQDTLGQPINAHGGGFLFHNDTYYWYGEIKSGPTYLPKSNANWGGTRVDLVGISCYSSRDLLNWKYRGNVLPAVVENSKHDLYVKNVAERSKVVYNAKTDKFVMWLHVDSMDYNKANYGVAISDRPEGPFEYLGSFQSGGQMARDLTVFVDDDSKAYLFTSSEDNAAIHVSELSDDYLSTTGSYSRIFVGRYMEAPTIFKRYGRYHFIGSGCTAWEPNAARSAVATSIWGPWVELGNPCRGEDADTTFHSQSTYVLPVSGGGSDSFMFAADRWNAKNLSDSRYVWLPISFEETSGNPIIEWQDEWSPLSI